MSAWQRIPAQVGSNTPGLTLRADLPILPRGQSGVTPDPLNRTILLARSQAGVGRHNAHRPNRPVTCHRPCTLPKS
eukprot:508268-Prymnesium_polylepis.1